MALKSSTQRYGTVAIVIHWVTALAILGLLVSGFRAADMTDPQAKAQLLAIHGGMGVSVLILTVLRIVWWLLADKRPAPAPGTPRWQAIAAHTVHIVLYFVIIVMAASGMGMIALSGAGEIIYMGAPGVLPDFEVYPPRIPHGLGARLMLALLALHIGVALYHQWVLRDRILARMGIGKAVG